MPEQTYLTKARQFREHGGEAVPAEGGQHEMPMSVPQARSPGATHASGRDGIAAAGAPTEEGATQAEMDSTVRIMLREMRPYLSRALQKVSDDGLLLLAKWNLHVAAERAIDARRPQPACETEDVSAKKARKAN
jgi:hypothetical protein